MSKNYDMAKVMKDYHWAQNEMNKMGMDYYFNHADEPFTTAHSVQQTIARTSSIILNDLRKNA